MRITAPSTMRRSLPAQRQRVSVRRIYQLLVSVLLLVAVSGCSSVLEVEPAAVNAASNPVSPTPVSSPSAATSPTPSLSPSPSPETSPEASTPSQPSQTASSTAGALATLATLPVKGRAPKTGYSRQEFGQAWADVDRNGCDTRNDVLGRDLSQKTYKAGTRNCVVLTGTLADPYTGKTIDFVRGATSSEVQIDHVVALSDAWQTGAQQLSVDQRTAFANDPANLLAVDGPANQQKSDSDAASWLPANKAYRCTYVSKQIAVKASYGLWVTKAERDAMERVLGNCSQAVKDPVPAASYAPAPPAAPLIGGDQQLGPEPFYANCKAVRAAGKAPIHRGQPGFLSKFDGDGDGVGCE